MNIKLMKGINKKNIIICSIAGWKERGCPGEIDNKKSVWFKILISLRAPKLLKVEQIPKSPNEAHK